jgi:uncharacterized RDD family membrane protein YckC
MTDPNDPQAEAPGPADAATEPAPVAWTDPLAPPPPPGYAPPPPGYAPPAAAPPGHWEPPTQSRPGPAPGYVYVGFWRRFAATLIDWILFFFLYLALVAVFLSRIDIGTWRVFVDIDPVSGQPLAPTGEILGATGAVLGALFAIFALLWLAHILYHVILWSWRGGTLGQLALGIQVRRESDGRRIGLGTAVLRYVGYFISTWALYIGLIWAAFDRRKQGWHDKIAGTLVIRRVD